MELSLINNINKKYVVSLLYHVRVDNIIFKRSFIIQLHVITINIIKIYFMKLNLINKINKKYFVSLLYHVRVDNIIFKQSFYNLVTRDNYQYDKNIFYEVKFNK